MIVLTSVFLLHVCFPPVRVVRTMPGCPGAHRPDRAGAVLLAFRWVIRVGQASADRAHSRRQQVR